MLNNFHFFFHFPGPFRKVHLEADAFFGDDKKAPPYFQIQFYMIQARTRLAKDFEKNFNLNPQVGFQL